MPTLPHNFELPIRTHSGKRKRKDVDEQDEHDSSRGQLRLSSSDSDESPSSWADDGRLSGQRHFPHQDLHHRSFSLPSLEGKGPLQPQRNIKHEHFAVINALLHRCLLEQDWPRAHRAYALLLRFDFHGKYVDLRKNAMWGIGAELLLQSRPQQTTTSPGDGDVEGKGEAATLDPAAWYSDEGFEAAKMYFERLILQHPFLPLRPDDVSAKTFYPAMLSLWIMQVQARDSRKQRELEARLGLDSDGEYDEYFDDAGDAYEKEITGAKDRRLRLAKEEILQQAQQIADRMDQIMRLPPFDRDVQMHRLRGNLAAWMLGLRRQAKLGPADHDRTLQTRATRCFDFIRNGGGAVPDELIRHIENPGKTSSDVDMSSVGGDY